MIKKNHLSEDFDLTAMKNIWKIPELFSNLDVGSWLEYTPFNKKETIDLFLFQLKKHRGHLNNSYRMIEILQTYVNSHPKKVVQCLTFMIDDSMNEGIIGYINSRDLYKIIESLLKIDIVLNDTTSLIRHLGELGYNKYLKLLDCA